MSARYALLASALFLSGCANDILSTKPEVRGLNMAGAATLRLTDFDDGRTVTVTPRAKLIITMTSNPTTGYSWQVSALDGLSLTSDTYVANPAPAGLVGSGGVQVFKFTAPDYAGASTLILDYQRSSADRISRRRLSVKTVK